MTPEGKRFLTQLYESHEALSVLAANRLQLKSQPQDNRRVVLSEILTEMEKLARGGYEKLVMEAALRFKNDVFEELDQLLGGPS